MTAVQENPVSTDAATEAEATPVPGFRKWCPKCYVDGIGRLINGFTIQHYDPTFPARIVPPLAPGAALSMQRSRDTIIAQRTNWPSDAAEHPRHAGAR
jgi:hypothetical protein